jgi:YfiH family protein
MLEWIFREESSIRYFQLNTEKLDNSIKCYFVVKNLQLNSYLFNSEPKEFLNVITKDKPLYYVNQIHSNIVYYVDSNFVSHQILNGDGLYTNRRNIFLGVKVADCLAIYFFIPGQPIIGIVHAGWKGTYKMISLKLADEIARKFSYQPEKIGYVFSAAISDCCYEVKEDVLENFRALIDRYQIYEAIRIKNNKKYLDLKKINDIILTRNGFKKLGDLNLCTYCASQYFFSFRRGDGNLHNWALICYN